MVTRSSKSNVLAFLLLLASTGLTSFSYAQDAARSVTIDSVDHVCFTPEVAGQIISKARVVKVQKIEDKAWVCLPSPIARDILEAVKGDIQTLRSALVAADKVVTEQNTKLGILETLNKDKNAVIQSQADRIKVQEKEIVDAKTYREMRWLWYSLWAVGGAAVAVTGALLIEHFVVK